MTASHAAEQSSPLTGRRAGWVAAMRLMGRVVGFEKKQERGRRSGGKRKIRRAWYGSDTLVAQDVDCRVGADRDGGCVDCWCRTSKLGQELFHTSRTRPADYRKHFDHCWWRCGIRCRAVVADHSLASGRAI